MMYKGEYTFKKAGMVFGISLIDQDIVRFRFNAGDFLKEEKTFVMEGVPPSIETEVEEYPDRVHLHYGELDVVIRYIPLVFVLRWKNISTF